MPRLILAFGKEKFAFQQQDLLSPLDVDVSLSSRADLRDVTSFADYKAIIIDDDFYRKEKKKARHQFYKLVQKTQIPFIIISSRKSIAALKEANELGATDLIFKPFNYREYFSRCRAVIEKKVRITCLGGGTGLFQILLGLKQLPRVLLTSVVSMSDDGGSSGRLRASFGILPPGDIRRSLIALSNAPKMMNELMKYRFNRGEHFSGHNLGNLFLIALTEITGSVSKAVRTISDILNLQGIVLPVTDSLATLCARFEDEREVKGESRIDLCEERNPHLRIADIWHEPFVKCTADAFSAIINADYIIIGPGDLYTSLVTNFLVGNVAEALKVTRAKKIYVCNLMTKPGETSNYTANDHVSEILRYMGGDFLDYVLVSNTKISEQAIADYSYKQQIPVLLKDGKSLKKKTSAKIILADIGHPTELVRHSSSKMRKEILRILKSERRLAVKQR